jgi:hypothetical protein
MGVVRRLLGSGFVFGFEISNFKFQILGHQHTAKTCPESLGKLTTSTINDANYHEH